MSTRTPPRLLLASASRARAALLRAAGYAFGQAPSGAAEPPPRPGEDAVAYAAGLAAAKASAAAAANPDAVVLAADTVAALGRTIIGKPESAADAARILGRLAGRTHRLVTAVCVAIPSAAGPTFLEGADEARVTLRAWSAERIRAHVRAVEPLYCAGAYAIQDGGSAIVERIEGDPTTIVGLPMSLVERLLARGGIRPAGAAAGRRKETGRKPRGPRPA